MHKPRTNSTNPNPGRLQLPHKRLSKHKNPSLGSPIGRQRGKRKKPSSRRRHNNMPTLPTRHKRRKKSPKRIDNPPEVDVKHPPPVLLGGIKKPSSNSNPSIGHHNVRHPMLSKHVLGKAPGSLPISNIKLKRTPPNKASSPRGSVKVNINTKHLTPMRGNSDGGSPPNPTTSPGNKRQLPTQSPPLLTNPPPNKLPRRSLSVEVINKLNNNPSNSINVIPNSPVRSNKRPPPKPVTPRVSSRKNSRRNKRIPSKRNLLNRRRNPPGSRPRNPPNHISPVQFNPIPSIPITSLKLPPQPRHPPNKLRKKRNLKSPNIPRMQPLPQKVTTPSPPHPSPHMIKIRTRNRGIGRKKLRPLSNGSPTLNRPPVMGDEVHRPPNGSHNGNKIPNQLGDPIPVPPKRRPRLPGPPHVIPNNPKPLPQHPHNPIPNGRIVRIPVHKQHHRPTDQPVLIDGQPHPTSLNPGSTHNHTVANTPDSACAKLQQASKPT